jgi:hypothetical protein
MKNTNRKHFPLFIDWKTNITKMSTEEKPKKSRKPKTDK